MSKTPNAERLIPRKKPAQARSSDTVDAILEAAARILESRGLTGYTTNEIAARAGVSVGSLYQYFPNKDAVTLALIAREHSDLMQSIAEAGTIEDWQEGLRRFIRSAVDYQLRRPALAKILDFEEARLSRETPTSNAASDLHSAVIQLLGRRAEFLPEGPTVAASDLIAITRALTDAAGERGESKTNPVERRIERAILGYLEESGQ